MVQSSPVRDAKRGGKKRFERFQSPVSSAISVASCKTSHLSVGARPSGSPLEHVRATLASAPLHETDHCCPCYRLLSGKGTVLLFLHRRWLLWRAGQDGLLREEGGPEAKFGSRSQPAEIESAVGEKTRNWRCQKWRRRRCIVQVVRTMLRSMCVLGNIGTLLSPGPPGPPA